MLRLEDISFHDSTVERFVIEGPDAILTIRDWQERIVRIRLKDLLYFRCYGIPDFVVEASVVYESPEIQEAINAVLADHGTAEGYNNFKLTQLNLENLVAVFANYEIQRSTPEGS